MSSVTLTKRSPGLLPAVERRQLLFLLRWLESAWFPWVWMTLCAVAHVGHALVSWHFFDTGAALLSSDEAGAGLHLYAVHPQLQIAPLAFLATTPLDGLAFWLSGAIAAVTIAAAAPAMLLSLSLLPGLTISNRQRGLAAAVLMPVWAELAVHYTHLDDALAPGPAGGRHPCGGPFSTPGGGPAAGGGRWRQAVGAGFRSPMRSG